MPKNNGTSSAESAHDAAHDAHDASQTAAQATEQVSEALEANSDVVATVATVAVVGIGAAVFEAALLPGVVLGIAAMWLPKYFPKMGEAINPLLRSTVRSAYKVGRKTKEMMAEAQEQVHDIDAEVHAEGEAGVTKAKTAAAG